MESQLFYFDIFKTLTDKNVQYVVVGGVAVNLHGIPRFTKDLDIVLAMEKENLRLFIQAMLELDYQVKIPIDPFDFCDEEKREEWINKKNMKVFNFVHKKNPFQAVDIVIEYIKPFDSISKNSEKINYKTLTIEVISIDDLIAMKESAGREQDLMDVYNLKKIKELGQKERGNGNT